MYVTSNTEDSYYQKAYDQNGYGGMAYYSSATCGYNESTGCTNAYEASEIKYVVDAWKTAKAPQASEARLLDYDDFENLGYELGNPTPSDTYWVKTENIPSWMYNNNYWYWAMDPKDDASTVFGVGRDGTLGNSSVGRNDGAVRPVITILKSALSN